MPQKLNKAGKMQDYIPKGNGDASGEYGTSNGTNKNFTTSDKKKSSANVITENKSVVVGDKKSNEIKKQQERYLTTDEYKKVVEKAKELGKKTDDVVDEIYSLQDKYGYDVDTALSKIKDNKANVIDDDLTGKKERAYDGSEYKSMTKEETQSIIDKLEKAGFAKDTSYSGGRTYKIYDKDTGNWNSISFSEDGKLFTTTINRVVYSYDNLQTAIDRSKYKNGIPPQKDAIGWETGAYKREVEDAYSRKHTKYDD